MANHPISLVSPLQVLQASIARNNDNLGSSQSFLPSTGSGNHPETSIAAGPGSILTDNYAMQSNDATAFIFGSTASERSATSSDYTTVDDATKLVNRAAIDNDVIEKIISDEKRRKKFKKSNRSATGSASSSQDDDTAVNKNEIDSRNSFLVMKHGLV